MLLTSDLLLAQENKKGDLIVGLAMTQGFSTLRNSEAPHKIYLFNSDIWPNSIDVNNIEKALNYSDYRTNIIDDRVSDLSGSAQIEYFIKNDLAISSGVSFIKKGIDLDSYKTTGQAASNAVLAERFELYIANEYLIIPVSIKKYLLRRKGIFIAGGIYTGYLRSSYVNYMIEKSQTRTSGEGNFYYSVNKSVLETEDKIKFEEFTSKLDFGLMAGIGYTKHLTNRLLVKSEMFFEFGLHKIDGKYNNEFFTVSSAIPFSVRDYVQQTILG